MSTFHIYNVEEYYDDVEYWCQDFTGEVCFRFLNEEQVL
jgi:hypothetical protein